MTSTWAEIGITVRAFLGDANGQQYNDNYLTPFYGPVFSDLCDALKESNSPQLEPIQYLVLPAHTDATKLASYGISSASSVLRVWAAPLSTVNILPIAVTPTVQLGTNFVKIAPDSTANYSDGDRVYISNEWRFMGGVTGTWTITLEGGYLVLMGCEATVKSVPYTGPIEGRVFKVESKHWGNQLPYVDMAPDQEFQATGGANVPNSWCTRSGLLRYSPPVAAPVGIKLQYRVSEDVTQMTPDSVQPIDGAGNFLAHWLAAKAAASRGNLEAYKHYGSLACGLNDRGIISPDAKQGLLGSLVNDAVNQNQIRSFPMRQNRIKNRGNRRSNLGRTY